ncbi:MULTISPECIES: alpha/beta fold hydrolase [Catenuloplanes]|uniref:ABC-2 type transport system ATP-binding protein n=1 Tax=Catenuloplanes niger TaxID=587534 RepID=A0AAE3ZPY9_9ACTN|nr:alpha/beta fold hydrolase [Catenuloplanes niger]MDR7323914.1 ABC-2 type transport system ATP-binding protein [Catenuloplanes niger]
MLRALTGRFRRALPRLTPRRAIAGSAALALVAGLTGWAVWPADPGFTFQDRMLTVRSGPTGDEPVMLDTRYFLPDGASETRKVPALLLAHGFGGDMHSVHAQAERLAAEGYAVLTWTARGFGRSGGQIHLDSADHEVKDAQRLLDWLAARPEVRLDAPGDPRVGALGGSYGGALALLLAAQDSRVDAIVPMITWNDLARAFLPNAAGGPVADGVFKKAWAGTFFSSGASGGASGGGASGGASGSPGGGPSGGVPGAVPAGLDPACGRFAPDVCAAFQTIATTGRATPDAVAVLDRSSPARVLDRIKAPTLLVQGLADTLFPLSEADANARGIAANGTPVRVAWYAGGHDGGAGPRTDRDRVDALTREWLDHYVAGTAGTPATSFVYSRVAGFDAMDRGLVTNAYTIADYPGLTGEPAVAVGVAGPPQRIANPPGGNPAAISSLPGAGSALSFVLGAAVSDLPGQHASFVSEPLADALDVGGSPRLRLRAASPTGEAVLFVKLYDVDPDGGGTLSEGLVAPVRLTGLPATIDDAQPVTVTLPGIVRRIDEGHRLRIVVATSDQAFAGPAAPAVYTVAVEPAVSLPVPGGTPIASPDAVWRWVLAGLLAVIALGLAAVLLIARARHRRIDRSVSAEHADTPLVVEGLRKEYADGFVAVSRVDFTVRRGQVVGLLGPNGAGKTTTLRVLMGLTQPTRGEIRIFGHRLTPGSPVLSRVGALVEGPGFLPHLTGEQNLRAYWKATGRPWADARFEEALEIAGLGDSVHRRTRKYSHGMRQRLAIAQAMLGLPELLVLDEPTDGLDPPQIAEMRRVLQRYATDGRAVLVSSHLLAEVEQTCTHAVVVNKGTIVASGPVEEIVGDSPTVQLDVDDPAAARAVLDGLDGARFLAEADNGGLVVDLTGTPRRELVAALVRAGVGVDRVVPRRRLEDAFLALVGDNSRGSGDR